MAPRTRKKAERAALTITEAAKRVGVPRERVKGWCALGRVKSFLVGSRTYVSVQSLDRTPEAKAAKKRKHYGKPTEMMAVRVPTELHKLLKTQARREGMPKSRKVVELLEAGLTVEPEPEKALDGSVFE